jgi:hypothetical protein
MSNPNQFFQDLSFDPEQITAVNKAYDLACQTLQNIGQPEVDREIIAARIFQAVESGERDARKLCERAIHGLTARLSAASKLMQGGALVCCFANRNKLRACWISSARPLPPPV